MSEATPANTPAEPEPETQCGEGMVYDKELGECVPKADQEVAGAGAASNAEKGLFPAVRATIQEALDKTVEEMEQKMVAMMKTELAKIQKEFASGLRKELGLESDPVVTKTELDAVVRKAVLDLKVGDPKKSPASPPLNKNQPPETPTKPGQIFKQYGKVN